MNRRVGIVLASAIATGLLLASAGLVAAQADQSSVQVACTAPAWAEGVSYSVGAKVTYQIVGDDEADLKLGLISISSPIARALIGKESGDVAEVRAPGGVKSYEIVGVRYK